MNLVTNGILMVSAASMTLGAIHLRMCFQERHRLTHIIFVVAAFGLAGYALFERAMMQAASPAEHLQLLRWTHVFAWLVIVPTAWFVHFYLQAGRRWLLWLLTVFRTVALFANFASTGNLNYREVTSINFVTVFGEPLSVAVGVSNPWMIVGQLSLVIFLIFSIDASVEVWRRGDRRRALSIGVCLVIFVVAGLAMSVLIAWGIIGMPLFASPFFLGVIAAMGYELTVDLQRAADLAHDLTQSRADLNETVEQLNLSSNAGSVGVWTKDIPGNEFRASEKWRELYGFAVSDDLVFDGVLARIHSMDRENIRLACEKAVDEGISYQMDFRILMPDGAARWIGSRCHVELKNGKPSLLRGADVDITKRKLAEEVAHDLSRKLMDAQEKERARIARELHDDLSQSLALLSINLQLLGTKSGDPDAFRTHVADLASQIQHVSSDVHRIAHEIHPAKLVRLGLESALRGFCREIAAAHQLQVEFESANVPRVLRDDVSLCLYRIAQESLQNIVKHSAASVANVNIELDEIEICLTVTDNGSGFDPDLEKFKESLGLVSISERIHAVKGTLRIDSTIGVGTKIEARVPFALAERHASANLSLTEHR